MKKLILLTLLVISGNAYSMDNWNGACPNGEQWCSDGEPRANCLAVISANLPDRTCSELSWDVIGTTTVYNNMDYTTYRFQASCTNAQNTITPLCYTEPDEYTCIGNSYWDDEQHICIDGSPPPTDDCPTPDSQELSVIETNTSAFQCVGGCEYQLTGSSDYCYTFPNSNDPNAQYCKYNSDATGETCTGSETPLAPTNPTPPDNNNDCPSNWQLDDNGVCEPITTQPTPNPDYPDAPPECPDGYAQYGNLCIPQTEPENPLEPAPNPNPNGSQPPNYSDYTPPDPDGNDPNGSDNNSGGGSEGTNDTDGDGNNEGDEEGECDPETQNCGEGEASGGQTCASQPVCTGDPLMCHQIFQQWQTRCAEYTQQVPNNMPSVATAKSVLGSDLPLSIDGIKQQLDDGETTFDMATITETNTVSSCPAPISKAVLGTTFTIEFTYFCQLAELISNLIMLAAWMLSISITYRAVT